MSKTFNVEESVKEFDITIGSDPEIFVTRNGVATSAFRLTTGTKEKPEDVGDGYFLSLDNIMLEGNIPPANSKDEFINNMNKLLSIMEQRASSMKMNLLSSDVAYPDSRTLRRPDANVFGCSEYTSAWIDGMQQAADLKAEIFRVAGSHIHMGYKNPTPEMNKAIAKAFDIFATHPSYLAFPCKERMGSYGGYGNYRCKADMYGLECRALGGYMFQPQFFGWMYEMSVRAIDFAHKNFDELMKMSLEDVKSFSESLKLEIK